MAAVLPIFYANVAGAELPKHQATAYWGYTTALALALAAVLSPIAGAAADAARARKKMLVAGALIGAAITGLLATVGHGQWLKASLIFIAAQLFFVIANVAYDALLPHVARGRNLDRISTRAYALGYLGGGLLLAVNMAMILFPEKLGIPSAGVAVRLTFVTVTVWWTLFTIPLIRHVREPVAETIAGPAASGAESDPGGAPGGDPGRAPSRTGCPGATGPGSNSAITFAAVVKETFVRLGRTMRDIRAHRNAMLFLFAFWIYNDGIGTIIKMATIYGTEIGIDRDALIGALLLVQFVGIPFTLLFGRWARKIGARPAVLAGLTVYTGIAIGGYFLQTAAHFWILALVVGMVQGGTQALSRSLFARLTPPEKSGEWFGFFSVSHRFAGIFGPLAFALVAQATGTGRNAILLLVVFFVLGGALLTRVEFPEEKPAGA